ncbi:MAG: T9SS type A sorting domain-containing protein [Armatimonadetes bacterium]|nr:T9SS type A sorting domain-containing protein [Armatimonadota bacterium]
MKKHVILICMIAFSITMLAQENALHFDGIDDVVVITNDPALNPANALTVEAWVKPDSIIYLPTIIGNEEWLNSDNGFILRIENSNLISTPQFQFGTASGWQCVSAPSGSIPLNTWTHIAGTFDGSSIKIFINGIEVSSTPFIGSMQASTVDLRIGGHYYTYNNRQWNGVIDEVRLWNIARTETEIFENMENPLSGLEPGLVGLWRMEEGSGYTTADFTGNGHDGFINGALWTQGYPMNTGSDNNLLPVVTELMGNYPNPFNPSTTISFELNTENFEDTEISIYNLKGQKIKQYSIFNNQSSIVWDGKDKSGNAVSSGIYLYRLETGKYSSTKKMLLMK